MTDGAVDAFWADAQVRVRLNDLRAYGVFNALESLCPPTWSFGDDPETADRLLGLVLDGTKTATASARRDYEAAEEPLPSVGSLAILTDGAGAPRALVVTTEVEVVPFTVVDAEHARLEGEGDGSLEGWRAEHRAFFERTGGAPVPDDLPVVLERFRVLYAV